MVPRMQRCQCFGVLVCSQPRLDPHDRAAARHVQQLAGGDAVDSSNAQLAIGPRVYLRVGQASVHHRSITLGSGFAENMGCADGFGDGEQRRHVRRCHLANRVANNE